MIKKPTKKNKKHYEWKRSAIKRGDSKLKKSPMTHKKGNQTKATHIQKGVKPKVHARDNGRCIFCGVEVGETLANSHFIPRSKYGLGIEENIMTNCNDCHKEWHRFNNGKDNGMNVKAVEHFKKCYPGWENMSLQLGDNKLKR